MKAWKLASLAVIAAATLTVVVQERRSIVPLPLSGEMALPPFETTQSAALFVGVREFAGDDAPPEVRYAVDDAIDLAWTFAFEPRVQLVEPEKVVLALSGEPVKDETKERLEQLLAAGAQRAAATKETIQELLTRQAGAVGSGGMFLISFATHGFIQKGEPYVLGATSSFERMDTALSALDITDAAARANRSLILMDACRERIPAGARGAAPRPLSAQLLTRRRSLTAGQAILYAPPFAFDDHASRNGVFTKAILEGLDCNAGSRNGAVTVDTLSSYVNTRVTRWLAKNHPGMSNSGILTSIDGNAGPLALSICKKCSPASPSSPATVEVSAATITVFDRKKHQLWGRDAGAAVIRAEAADLDCDGNVEVIAATRNRIVVFDQSGAERWSVQSPTPLTTFRTGALFAAHRLQIVTLSRSQMAVYEPEGTLRTAFAYDGALQDLAIDRPTSHHDWKIVLTTGDGKALLLKPRQLDKRKIEWSGVVAPQQPIRGLEIRDADNDSRRDIILHTAGGHVVLTFDGTVIRPDGVQFVRLAQKGTRGKAGR